jgi:hypothetical protein
MHDDIRMEITVERVKVASISRCQSLPKRAFVVLAAHAFKMMTARRLSCRFGGAYSADWRRFSFTPTSRCWLGFRRHSRERDRLSLQPDLRPLSLL